MLELPEPVELLSLLPDELLPEPDDPWPELPLPDAVPCRPGEPAPEELVLLPEEPEEPELPAPVWPLLP